jgi:hypothetical protein
MANSPMTEATTFRPRNGVPALAYWQIRRWCEVNGFTLSDVLNALFPAIAYYLENHSRIDKLRSKATVDLYIGPLDILHVFNGKCYPLATQTNAQQKHTITLDDIQTRIDFWIEQNKVAPSQIDLLLLDQDRAKSKIKNRHSRN